MATLTELATHIRQLPDSDLAGAWMLTMRELRDRGLVRSSNNPVGDLAEGIVAAHFNGRLAPKGSRGWDVEGSDGTRYQVKSRRVTAENKSRLLGQIRNLEGQEFASLIAVIFDEVLAVEEIWHIPHDQIAPHARYRPHTNSWALTCSGKLLKAPGVLRLQ